MIIFYGFILAIYLWVFLNEKITLHYVLGRIAKKSREYRFYTYAFIVISSYILFPIGISQGLFSFILIVVSYFYIGGIFYGLHPKNPLMAFGVAILLQGLGLFCRLIFKLETYPARNDLRISAIGSYIIVVPAFIMLIYLLVPFFLKLEAKNYFPLNKKL